MIELVVAALKISVVCVTHKLFYNTFDKCTANWNTLLLMYKTMYEIKTSIKYKHKNAILFRKMLELVLHLLLVKLAWASESGDILEALNLLPSAARSGRTSGHLDNSCERPRIIQPRPWLVTLKQGTYLNNQDGHIKVAFGVLCPFFCLKIYDLEWATAVLSQVIVSCDWDCSCIFLSRILAPRANTTVI